MHFTDAAVFPRLVWTARTAGKGISIGTDVMSRVSFQLFFFLKKTYFYVQNLHAVIYLIKFCIFSLNLFIVRIVFLLHAVIFFACCFTLVCRNKSPTGLMLHVCEYSTKKKFLCLCLCLFICIVPSSLHSCVQGTNFPPPHPNPLVK